MTRIRKASALMLAAGTTAAFAASASAQPVLIEGPTLINISGATLFESFLTAPASTNDFIDVDGDGIAGIFNSFPPDQLVPSNTNDPIYGQDSNGAPIQVWNTIYRATGSGNGFQELIDFGQTFDTSAANSGTGLSPAAAENAYYNGIKFIDEDTGNQADFTTANPGGAPVRQIADSRVLAGVDYDSDGVDDTAPLFLAVAPGTSNDTVDGIQVTTSSIDVPPSLFVTISGSADPFRRPNVSGYGNNPRVAPDKEGEVSGQDQLLADLGGLSLFDPNVTPDENTIFGTPVAYVPLGYPVNYGVGREVATVSELQWGFVSGRLPNGENLTFVARDSGSGTRNAAITSLCLDPSWGLGDGVGVKNSDDINGTIGSAYLPASKGGSGTLEETVRNTRLAIGHTGAERGASKGWLSNGEFDLLALINDVNGTAAAQPVRPTADTVVFNSDPDTGYQYGGVSTFATIGDPRAADVSLGGDPGNMNPPMANSAGAAYLNNITRSIAAFTTDPGGSDTFFTPGEFIALNFIPVAALDNQQDPLNPCIYLPADTNTNAQQAVRDLNVLNRSEYTTFGDNNIFGIVPTRLDDRDYNDGLGNAPGAYATFAGTEIAYAVLDWGQDGTLALENANRVAGDFNNDGNRDTNDIPLLIDAWDAVNVGARTDFSGNQAISPEIIGDFNADGFFDRFDVRFFADGLAIDPATGELDRNAGFTMVDMAFGGNFFGTTLATGASYQNGDARGDLANADSFGTTRGWAPVGPEGYNRDSQQINGGPITPAAANVIDQRDIEYVFDQFRGNDSGGNPVAIADGEANWGADLAEAGFSDLSADLTGDKVINIDDANELISGILQTSFADANLDGVVNADDEQVVQDTIDGVTMPDDPANPLFTEGDLNGDDVVDSADLAIAQGNADPVCPGDTDGDGIVGLNDLLVVLGNFGDTEASGRADGDVAGGDNLVGLDDLLLVLGVFGTAWN